MLIAYKCYCDNIQDVDPLQFFPLTVISDIQVLSNYSKNRQLKILKIVSNQNVFLHIYMYIWYLVHYA